MIILGSSVYKHFWNSDQLVFRSALKFVSASDPYCIYCEHNAYLFYTRSPNLYKKFVQETCTDACHQHCVVFWSTVCESFCYTTICTEQSIVTPFYSMQVSCKKAEG